MLVKDLLRRRKRWLKHAWIALIEQRNIEHAAAVHATSEEEARELREFGFALPPVKVIPNGINIADISCSVDQPEEDDVPGTIGNPVLLFLGRINWKKGLDRLIAALRYVPHAVLVIAGNDEENYQRKLESFADREGVRGRIRFVGPVYAERKASLFRKASALVLPSYSENFGNVVLEAMVAGLPVVVTPEVGAADIVRKSGGGIVVNGDPETLGNALKELLSDPVRLRAMGESGKKGTRESYGWETIAREMERLYLDVSKQAS
jgi:glycosyltransferase involved in cell wall biosynthesis